MASRAAIGRYVVHRAPWSRYPRRDVIHEVLHVMRDGMGAHSPRCVSVPKVSPATARGSPIDDERTPS